MVEFKLIFQFLISPNCQRRRRLTGVNLAVFRKPNTWKILRFSCLNNVPPSKYSTRFTNGLEIAISRCSWNQPFVSHDSPDMGGKSSSLARRSFKVCKSSVLSSGYLVCSVRKYSSYGVVTEYAIWCLDRGFSGRVRNTHKTQKRKAVGRRIELCGG